MNPSFSVPAEYFYALTADLPSAVTAEQRYQQVIRQREAQILDELQKAIDAGIIPGNLPTNRYQATRRLHALGTATDPAPEYVVFGPPAPGQPAQPIQPVYALVQSWLNQNTATIAPNWWVSAANNAAHLDLVLWALTDGHAGLSTAIKTVAIPAANPADQVDPVNDVSELAARTDRQWRIFFQGRDNLLPAFTEPGSAEERVEAFIRHLRKFFDIETVPADAPVLNSGVLPTFGYSSNDIFARFAANYGAGFAFGGVWNNATFQAALTATFPDDSDARAWLDEALRTIDALYILTADNENCPDIEIDLRFSIMEALYASGFTRVEQVCELTLVDFQQGLIGTVAYDYAQAIYCRAACSVQPIHPSDGTFHPINPDGRLNNCIPPLHLSPLGPFAYLRDLTNVATTSTCEDPLPRSAEHTITSVLDSRDRRPDQLQVTRANLEIPLPMIDLVNEHLEALAAEAGPAIYNTSSDKLDIHSLRSVGEPESASILYRHDPVTLYEALPEHSSPATEIKNPVAYENLKKDFSAPTLPYSQPLDFARAYLHPLHTTRYAVMRRFREKITEFVLDPANEPADFQQHLWRYPVRIDTAIEYLGISPEEYQNLFTKDIKTIRTSGFLTLFELYGYQAAGSGDNLWSKLVVRLSEFLKRTGLTYCEFFDLWKSEVVKFSRQGEETSFPDCEPCCLDDYIIQFESPRNPNDALRRLIVFIRLWRKLKEADPDNYRFAKLGEKAYTFSELRDICEVLQLYIGNNINPDFIRQLAAFQMLRDHFALELSDGKAAPAGATGADRTKLLALWEPAALANPNWNWAVGHLIEQIQHYAQKRHESDSRDPEFLKLLRANLNPLSRLIGFDPETPAETWHRYPTHTLRFAEVLAKIYASEFSIGELWFLFLVTNVPNVKVGDHLDGDDPFEIPTDEETSDSPLDFPDDEDDFSLWSLRDKLWRVKGSDETAAEWTWAQIESVLYGEFGYMPPGGGAIDPLLSLGEHFFPSALEQSGRIVPLLNRQYRVDLGIAPESIRMWNTPPAGPFSYDLASQKLWTQLPLIDEAVVGKISRIRQLNDLEQEAVRDLYFLPRLDLAHFAFIFDNFAQAEEFLIQEPDEAKRWAYFQKAFATFYKRCRIIAEHLSEHVVRATKMPTSEGYNLAWRILTHLYADENRALANWEADGGQLPAVTWSPQPNGGAFAALLGVMGTGLRGEYSVEYPNVGEVLVWRERHGGLDAFGDIRNDWNAPVPTILPAMNLQATDPQQKFVFLHNGYAFTNPNDQRLGGAQGFRAKWTGSLLVEADGKYQFWAGAPTPDDAVPDFKAAQNRRWRVTLERGQKTWVLLNNRWPGEDAPAADTTSLDLRRGTYHITIEFQQPQPAFDRLENVNPQNTGFQLKYSGPDTQQSITTIPFARLFDETKDDTLDTGVSEWVSVREGARPIGGEAQKFLRVRYASTLRDMRRTYQRAFKALLFAHRFELSAKHIADSGQSEIGYMLWQEDLFAGRSYYKNGANFTTHKANFNFNLLPVFDDPLYNPPLAQDQRVQPSSQRQQALFDWWERIFDYTDMRKQTQSASERPAWLLFHEAAEVHEDPPTQMLRHLGVDESHAPLVRRYHQGYRVTSDDLEDERWAIRAWRAELWIRDVMAAFFCEDIRDVRPDLWAGDDLVTVMGGETESANQNLAHFVRIGFFENGSPRRYAEIKQLDDDLRERARRALFAYLCGMNRVTLPDGSPAQTPKDLSDLLLIDVEVGLCEKASRVEEAVSAIQIYVQRARLGLEPGFPVSSAFAQAWDRHFATFRTWEMCKRRVLYRENWVEWDELEKARRTEAFIFLEDQLRRSTLTVAVPGGLEHWDNERPPIHPSLTFLQHREPASIRWLVPKREGFDLLGTPDRHARPSWLAPMHSEISLPPPDDNGDDGDDGDDVGDPTTPPDISVLFASLPAETTPTLPFWMEAAVRLGARFIRVAAASIPPASTGFEPRHDDTSVPCCLECGKRHDPVIDEYYFWLMDTRAFTALTQEAVMTKNWHNLADLPSLLQWDSEPMVHLVWCRVHNGEFQPPRRSDQGVLLNATPELQFVGRKADSLHFEVAGGQAPVGYPLTSLPGFRYDMTIDEAVVLPLITPVPTYPTFLGGLFAYPFFIHFKPGNRVLPPSLFSPALTLANALRAHCQYEAALKWYESVFNPLKSDLQVLWCPQLVETPGDGGSEEPPPVFAEGPGDDGGDGDDVSRQPENGCCQDVVAPNDDFARRRAINLHYMETLLDWGDAQMRLNTPEAFQQARLTFDTVARMLGQHPRTVINSDDDPEPPTVEDFEPRFATLNPRLLALYERTADRLNLIHNCLNARRLKNGQPNQDMPYWGNTTLRGGWRETAQACLDEDDWCYPPSPYRFLFVIQKAQELASEVRGLGSALLAAYEKGDAEYLAALRASHERQALSLALSVRKDQWREADWQIQALQKAKEIAQTRRRYYNNLIIRGNISEETQYEAFTIASAAARAAGNILEGVAQGIAFTPDIYTGTVAIFPIFLAQQPIGSKLAGIFSTAARILNGLAEIGNTTAGLNLTYASWVRREEEWRHQVEILDIEIEQIERQILAAERRRDISLTELNNHQRQIENSTEVINFLRDKFTSHALYIWHQKETAALYESIYNLAMHTLRQGNRAFNYERGHTAQNFVPADAWDNLREGLLAGERLQLAARRMEKTYLDDNLREYELTKHVSLRLHFPMQLLQLKVTGYCEIEIPEWMFDLDYPGHYMRRIKNVTLTLPCVVGPYTGIHCRLTLLSNVTRVDPRLRDLQSECCDDREPDNGYEALPDDPRLVKQYAATEAIATSSGQNDSGMFDLNFRDERYLPFEFAGAVSRWRIELPQDNNYFVIDTLSDVVLHLNYTAREGGRVLRNEANIVAQRHLPDSGVRFFDVQHELPNAWHRFQESIKNEKDTKYLNLQLNRQMFAFLPGHRNLFIKQVVILFEAPGADPSAQQIVQFTSDQLEGPRNVQCVASVEWPGLFHGVLEEGDIAFGPISEHRDYDFGRLMFPPTIQSVSRLYLFCRYDVS